MAKVMRTSKRSKRGEKGVVMDMEKKETVAKHGGVRKGEKRRGKPRRGWNQVKRRVRIREDWPS